MAHSVYPEIAPTDPAGQTRKEFATDQDVRWCPGCGDYSILAQVQRMLPSLAIPRENYVFISGIGCSSRFPYYMDTYGMHSIHGRAPAIATGVKSANPNLSVWMVTGDGDGLSIGGNHFMHVLRRNVDIKLLMFNNRIYGLTKGQYSPTSPVGKRAKSTPMGSIDHPVDPAGLALGAGATFVARTFDTHVKHIQAILKRGADHKGTAFVEIYQNCPIFNDNEFISLTDKSTKADTVLELEHGKPMIFGKLKDKGIALDDKGHPIVVDVEAHGEDKLLVHDEEDLTVALILSQMGQNGLPTPIGVLRAVKRPTYDEMMQEQVETAQAGPKNSVQDLLDMGQWTVE